MEKLSIVRMSNNRLLSLPQEVSDSCPLERLDLHGNQLSHLPEELFSKAKKLVVVDSRSMNAYYTYYSCIDYQFNIATPVLR